MKYNFEMERAIDTYLSDNNLYTSYVEVREDNRLTLVKVDIEWGDWKHEHLRCDYLMEEYFEKHGLAIERYNNLVLEEDGSDTYSGSHIYEVCSAIKGGV